MDRWDDIVEALGRDEVDGEGDSIIVIDPTHRDPRLTTSKLLAMFLEREVDYANLRSIVRAAQEEAGAVSTNLGYLLRLCVTMLNENPAYNVHPDYIRLPEALKKALEFQINQLQDAQVLEAAPSVGESNNKKEGYTKAHKIKQ
jgi:hypothetical protein